MGGNERDDTSSMTSFASVSSTSTPDHDATKVNQMVLWWRQQLWKTSMRSHLSQLPTTVVTSIQKKSKKHYNLIQGMQSGSLRYLYTVCD